ncbi:hypothetical protein ABVT39_018384 [Epinephelus coioides]
MANSYLSYVQCLGSRSRKIILVYDGHSSSCPNPVSKNSCFDQQFRPVKIHLTARAKFMDNTHNKSELIHLLFSTFQKHPITVEHCDNNADTLIVAAATNDTVEVIMKHCCSTYINCDSVVDILLFCAVF